jgi:hypothetical protein
MKELVTIKVDYITVGHLLVRSLHWRSSLSEANGTHNGAMHQVFLYFKTAYDSAEIEVMCKILTEIKESKKCVEIH